MIVADFTDRMAAQEMEKEWASKVPQPACLYCGAVNPRRDSDGCCEECGGPVTNSGGKSDDSVSVILEDDGALEAEIERELATVKKA